MRVLRLPGTCAPAEQPGTMSASASSVERERDRLVLLLMAAKDGEVATLRRLVREYGS